MQHSQISFLPLLIVIGLAFLVPLILSRLRGIVIPIVVGEIIAGIIVGKSGLNLVHEGTVLRILSELGFAYLMFLSGLEIDFSAVSGGRAKGGSSRLARLMGNPFVVGHALFLLTLGGSALAALFLTARGLIHEPWIMALILSTTSLGVVVPVIKEQGLTGERYGQLLLVSSLVADFASILLISVYVLLRSQGPSTQILLVLVLFAAFVATYRLATLFRKHLPAEHIFEELSSATSQIKTRGSLALALVFIALAEELGIENILGAFLAGVIVSLLSEGEGSALREKLDAIGYGFFVPIFFIMVGADFDLPALLSSGRALLLVPVLIGIAYLVKFIPALILRLGYSWRETIAGGVLLSSRLSLIIAAAAIGLELGLISQAVNSAIILVAIITCTLSPLLFNWLSPERKARERVVVVGSRPSAGPLARRLRDHGLDVVLVCGDATQNQQAMSLDVPVVSRSDSLADALRQGDVRQARTVVAMEDKDEENLRICRMARHIYGVEIAVAWVRDPAQNDKFRKLGARVVNPAYSAMLIIESMVLNPGTFSLTPDVDETQAVHEVKLQNPRLVGRPLHEVRLPGVATLLMIQRGGSVLVPDRDTVLRANDVITLAGVEEDVDKAARLLAHNGL
jgi:trk system potassium uptake protein TrkA